MTWIPLDDELIDAAGNSGVTLIAKRVLANTIENARTRLKRHAAWWPGYKSTSFNVPVGSAGALGPGDVERFAWLQVATLPQQPLGLPIAFPLSHRATKVRIAVSGLATVADTVIDVAATVIRDGVHYPRALNESDYPAADATIPDIRECAAPGFVTFTGAGATDGALTEAWQTRIIDVAIPSVAETRECTAVNADDSTIPAFVLLWIHGRYTAARPTSQRTIGIIDRTTIAHNSARFDGPWGCVWIEIERPDGGPNRMHAVVQEYDAGSLFNCPVWPPIDYLPAGSSVSAEHCPAPIFRLCSVTIQEMAE